MKLEHAQRAEAATLYSAKRYVHGLENGLDLTFARGRGVLVNWGFLVTDAHGIAKCSVPVGTCDLGGLWLLVRKHGLELAGRDVCLTTSREKPTEIPVIPNYARLVAEGARALVGPTEDLAVPAFVDPMTDIALLTRATYLSETVPVRRTPIVEPEPVHLYACERGWVRAIATPKPGPLVEISGYERRGVLQHGDCGGPVLDENGELVTIVNCGEGDAPGYAGQLALSLPAWLLARV